VERDGPCGGSPVRFHNPDVSVYDANQACGVWCECGVSVNSIPLGVVSLAVFLTEGALVKLAGSVASGTEGVVMTSADTAA